MFYNTGTNFWNSTWTKPDFMPIIISSDSRHWHCRQVSADESPLKYLFYLRCWLDWFHCWRL